MALPVRGVTFDPDALWAKSKAFMERALRARDRQDDLEFHLWAALALELIGKSALAAISPALVADPNHLDSLLFACGLKEPADKRSVTARTVFERLTRIIPEFDKKLQEQCIGIADRRNAELHSGESPMVGLDPRAWVPMFWKCANAVVVGRGKTLTEWVGTAEAKRVESVLKDAAKLLATTVQARIERSKAEYDKRLAPGSKERKLAKEHARGNGVPARISAQADDVENHNCPSCDSKGWLLGYVDSEQVHGQFAEGDEDGFTELVEAVTVTYKVDGFACPECGLRLEGKDEISIAALPSSFERDESRAATYEEEYGND